MSKKNKNNTGFTLVETLVAISILIVAVTASFAAAQSGISSSIYSKNQVIAFYLGAEAVEQVRNARDVNALEGRNWLYGISNDLTDPCYFGKKCIIDATNNTITTCGGTCPFIKQEPTTGFYGNNPTWADTVFKREVSLSKINDHEISILVRMTWSKGTNNQEYIIRENMFDWK